MRKEAILILIILIMQCFSTPVYALDNITIHDTNDSASILMENKMDKLYLKKEWYSNKFIINPIQKVGLLNIDSVDSKEYVKALTQIKCTLEDIGPYNIYFLDYQLKSHNIRALSFPDNSVVVFGSYQRFSSIEIHQLAVHELGHQVHFKYMTSQKLWNEYKKIRGIENGLIYNDSSEIYINRPQEVFAEDFRLLFGGELATFNEHINSSLEDPRQIEELKRFFGSFLVM